MLQALQAQRQLGQLAARLQRVQSSGQLAGERLCGLDAHVQGPPNLGAGLLVLSLALACGGLLVWRREARDLGYDR